MKPSAEQVKYTEAKRALVQLRESHSAAVRAVSRHKEKIAEKVAQHHGGNGAWDYSLEQRDQDSSALAKLIAKLGGIEEQRQKLQAVVTAFEADGFHVQHRRAIAGMTLARQEALPICTEAVRALSTLCECLAQLHPIQERHQAGKENLRRSRQNLAALGIAADTPLDLDLPVTTAAILNYLGARYRLNVNAPREYREPAEAFAGVLDLPSTFDDVEEEALCG